LHRISYLRVLFLYFTDDDKRYDMAHVAPKGDYRKRGAWCCVLDEETGGKIIRLRCPVCCTVISLNCYVIHPSGLVMAPVECTFEGCHFFENVVLEDWED